MNCSPELLEAYLDRELDAAGQATVEQHLAKCADCTEAYARLNKQKAGIRAAAPYYKRPAALESSLRAGVRRLEADAAKPPKALPWRGLAVAASVLLAVSISWNLVQ